MSGVLKIGQLVVVTSLVISIRDLHINVMTAARVANVINQKCPFLEFPISDFERNIQTL